ncbi:hypothetical protein [Empedobacter falsenii]
MEYLQKLSKQGKNPLQVINLIYNNILFGKTDDLIFDKGKEKLHFNYIKEINSYNTDIGIGINNPYLLEKIDDILFINNPSIKTAIIYLIVKSPKLMTITEYILIRNSLNFDSLVSYTFDDFDNFLNHNKQDYRIKMFLYFYFQDVYDINFENECISKEEYGNKLDYFLNKSIEYSNFL